MKRISGIALLLFSPGLLVPESPAGGPEKPLVFTHVNVIDSTGAPARPDMTVVIAGRHITALAKTGTIQVPKDAQVVDAAGKFLIPGLWDMHVHAFSNAERFLPLWFFYLSVANGVTGLRDMGGWAEQIEQDIEWKKAIAVGAVLGPHLIMAGAPVEGPKPQWPHAVAVSDPAQARDAVRSLKQRGVDFVKVFAMLPRESYMALADETRKQGLSFVGHVPVYVTGEEASDAGQKSFEHLWGVLPACSAREEELTKALLEESTRAGVRPSQSRAYNVYAKALRESYSETKAAALFARFVRNGTWQVPTLVIRAMRVHTDEEGQAGNWRLKYIPPAIQQEWWKEVGRAGDSNEVSARKSLYESSLMLVTAMRRAGVRFMTGTDAMFTFLVPGFSLHDELGLFVKAGFTPLEALQAATLNPAKFLGREKEFGTVEKGKLADLVLLDANPLEDIRNTQKIRAVVLDGKYLDRTQLDSMLAQVEAAAKLAEVRTTQLQHSRFFPAPGNSCYGWGGGPYSGGPLTAPSASATPGAPARPRPGRGRGIPAG